jgi:hypothetical protein
VIQADEKGYGKLSVGEVQIVEDGSVLSGAIQTCLSIVRNGNSIHLIESNLVPTTKGSRQNWSDQVLALIEAWYLKMQQLPAQNAAVCLQEHMRVEGYIPIESKAFKNVQSIERVIQKLVRDCQGTTAHQHVDVLVQRLNVLLDEKMNTIIGAHFLAYLISAWAELEAVQKGLGTLVPGDVTIACRIVPQEDVRKFQEYVCIKREKGTYAVLLGSVQDSLPDAEEAWVAMMYRLGNTYLNRLDIEQD